MRGIRFLRNDKIDKITRVKEVVLVKIWLKLRNKGVREMSKLTKIQFVKEGNLECQLAKKKNKIDKIITRGVRVNNPSNYTEFTKLTQLTQPPGNFVNSFISVKYVGL